MAADSTLVKAAFSEATSRAGVDVPNLKPLYDSNTENMKSYLGIVTGAVDAFKKDEETLRIGKEKQLAGFKEIMNTNYKNLFTEGQNMPQEVVNAVDEVVRRLQDDFEKVNTYGKNDNVENERARTRINAELKKVINQAVNARATFGILGKDTKSWNDGAVKGDVEAMKRMFNLDAVDKDDNVSVYFDDNLKLTFRVVDHMTRGGFGADGLYQETYGDVSYNMDQLRKNIPEANLKADGVIFETLTSVGTQATTAGTKGVNNWSEEEVNSIFAKQVQTKEDFTNLAFRRLDDVHDQSFRTNLVENMDVAIDTMDATFLGMFGKMDRNNGGKGDGVIDSKDLADLSGTDLAVFKANYKQMIDVLTDVDNDDFNLDRSKNLLAGYFTGFAKQKYDTNYDSAVKAKEARDKINNPNGATGSQIIYGNSNLGEKSFELQDDILDKAMRSEPIYSWGGDRFDPDPNKPGNYILEGTQISKPIDGILRGKHFGMNERINSRKLEYTTGIPIINQGDGTEEKPYNADFGSDNYRKPTKDDVGKYFIQNGKMMKWNGKQLIDIK